MQELITISRQELANLEERARQLAREKSYLQLFYQLTDKLGRMPGLDNVVENIVKLILDSIGGVNVTLYYLVGGQWHYVDVYGKKGTAATLDDELVKEAVAKRALVEFFHDFGDTKMLTAEFTKAATWATPLVVGDDLFGVLKSEGMLLAACDARAQLQTFLNYCALVLKNEIQEYGKLKQAYDQLAEEVAQRYRVEEELRASKEELELRVLERTAELRSAGEQLRTELVQRLRAEDELRQSEQLWRAVFGAAKDAVLLLDNRYTVIACNDAATALYGRNPAGMNLRDLRAEPTRAELDEQMARAARENGGRWETLHLHADGTPFEVEVSTRPFASGGSQHFVHIVRDITERRRNEERDRRLAAIVRSSDDAIIGKSLDGVITSWNRGAEAMYGYQEDEIVGQSVATLVPPDRREEFRHILATISRGEHVDHFETVRVRKDGAHISVSLTISPIRSGEGKIVGASTIARDVTERKRLEAEREDLVATLQIRNAEMERFVYTISHELKSPLVTANCYLGLLKEHLEEGNTEAVTSDMARIVRANTHMHQLLGELLDLCRIGRVVEPSASVPFAELAREAVELVAAQIAARNVEVTIAADLPAVYGDRARLLQVMENLLTNAVKFMGDQPRPHVDIGARRDGNKTVYFVRDNGIGIDPRYLGRVFRLFERLEPSVEGTGAGLAIVKQIVELHGGRIWVESEGRGKGATFCFTLAEGPRASVSSTEPASSSSGATA